MTNHPKLSQVRLLAFALAVGVPGVVSQAGQATSAHPSTERPEQVDLAKKPPYWRDERFAMEIRFPEAKSTRPAESVFLRRDPLADPKDPKPSYETVRMIGGRVLPLSEAVTLVSKTTGASVRAQGDWERDPVAVPLAAGPAREWMDALAKAYRGSWQKIGETWILARTPSEARYTLLTETERLEHRDAAVQSVFKGMSPALWQRLVNGDRLEYRDLAPAQQQAVVEMMRLAYYDTASVSPGTTALYGYPVTIQYSNQGRNASLTFNVQTPEGRGFGMDAPFYHPLTGALTWGVVPPK